MKFSNNTTGEKNNRTVRTAEMHVPSCCWGPFDFFCGCWDLPSLFCFQLPCPLAVGLHFTSLHIFTGANLCTEDGGILSRAEYICSMRVLICRYAGRATTGLPPRRPLRLLAFFLIEAKCIQKQNPSQNISRSSPVSPIYFHCSVGDRVNTHCSGTSLQNITRRS